MESGPRGLWIEEECPVSGVFEKGIYDLLSLVNGCASIYCRVEPVRKLVGDARLEVICDIVK